MTKKELKKLAKQSILDGNTQQETYDNLRENCKLSSEDLANIIRYIPTLQTRKKYNTLNVILIVILFITVLLKMMSGVPLIIENGIKWLPILFILPIVNILLLIGVATYYPNSHRFVAIFTIIGLLRVLKSVFSVPFDPFVLFDLSIAIGLIVLGFYLNAKLFKNYSLVKELYQNNLGQDRMRYTVKFED